MHDDALRPMVQLYTSHHRLAVSERLESRYPLRFIGGLSQCHCRQF